MLLCIAARVADGVDLYNHYSIKLGGLQEAVLFLAKEIYKRVATIGVCKRKQQQEICFLVAVCNFWHQNGIKNPSRGPKTLDI